MAKIQTCPSRSSAFVTDDSDDLKDMRYAERFICNKETLELLSSLEVHTEYMKKFLHVTALKHELNTLYYNDSADPLRNYIGEYVTSACRKVNSVFVALEIPYLTAEMKSRMAMREGNPNDMLKIYKYSYVFDPKKYRCVAGNIRNEKGKLLDYEEPTEGARKRLKKWMSEVGIKEIGRDVINKLEYK